MAIEGFWSKPPDYGRSRELDSLSLSTVHEAAADVLVRFLSGGTWRAEDYLWFLVGLRWTGEHSATEIEIWEYFANFEKALKLSWYHQGSAAGFRGRSRALLPVARISNSSSQLASNQRSQGLLGAYLRSLREAGFVEHRSLSSEI